MSVSNSSKPKTKVTPVNRLIIIGNGFDLAHGMKTRYSDFIFDLLRAHLLKPKDIEFQNPLFHLETNAGWNFNNLENAKDIKSILDYTNLLLKVNSDFSYYPLGEELNLKNNSLQKIQSNKRNLMFRHIFLEKSLADLESLTWSGFETQYYNTILEIINFAKNNGNNLRQECEMIKNLNRYFTVLKNEFENYIRTIKYPESSKNFKTQLANSESSERFINYLSLSLNETYNYSRNRAQDDWSYTPEKTLILDFNYTNTVLSYKHHSRLSQDELIHIKIHGDIDNAEKPIIFGYGDELHEDYKVIENRDNNEYLRYFKAFGYSYNSDYKRMINFIEDAPYETFILGHSCGLSDRVMLNTIFEHAHCTAIRIFYHRQDDTDDFLELSQNISRHFSIHKRAEMRAKVISKDRCFPMPQLKF